MNYQLVVMRDNIKKLSKLQRLSLKFLRRLWIEVRYPNIADGVSATYSPPVKGTDSKG